MGSGFQPVCFVKADGVKRSAEQFGIEDADAADFSLHLLRPSLPDAIVPCCILVLQVENDVNLRFHFHRLSIQQRRLVPPQPHRIKRRFHK